MIDFEIATEEEVLELIEQLESLETLTRDQEILLDQCNIWCADVLASALEV